MTGAPVQLQTDGKTMAKVAAYTDRDIMKIISETKFVYGENKHEYTTIKIEIGEEEEGHSDPVKCKLTLISEQHKLITLTVDASWNDPKGDVNVVYSGVREFQNYDVGPQNTWFLNLCKQFKLLGPWIKFPTESEDSSESRI